MTKRNSGIIIFMYTSRFGLRARRGSCGNDQNGKQGLKMNEQEQCTHNCESCGADCPSRTQGIPKEKLNEMSQVKRVIGVVSGKGGVGKSLVTSMLAVLMNRRGYRAAVLDADVTGPSIPRMFGVRERAKGNELGLFPAETSSGIKLMSINLLLENEEDPVVWRGPIIAGTVKQFWTDVVWDQVDYMFVDMPPGTGDVPLTVFQSLPVDGIVVVTSPQELVSMIVAKAVNMAKLMNVPVLGLVENYSYTVCPDCGKRIPLFGASKAEETAAQFGLPLLAQIPLDPSVAAACDEGKVETVPGEWMNRAADLLEQLR